MKLLACPTSVLSVVIVFLVIAVASSGRNFYEILGVSKTANANQVKKAYRNLAKQLHPDKNKNDPRAEDRFRDLNDAYEVLIDEEKRKIYDQHGEDGLKGRQQEEGGDPFASFFGGGGFSFFGEEEHQGEREIPKGGDVLMDLDVTLEELYNGDFVQVIRYKPVKRAASGTRKCKCRAEMRSHAIGPGRFQMTQVEVCEDCPNVQFVPEEKTLEIEIEPGMRDGQIYPFVAEGEPHIDGDPGDLKFRIHQIPHRLFERRGDDLYTNATISLIDALNGFDMNVTHLDGHQVSIKRSEVTAPQQRIRRPNEGMPNYENNNVRGSLFVTFDIEFPRELEISPEQKLSIMEILKQNSSQRAYNGLNMGWQKSASR